MFTGYSKLFEVPELLQCPWCGSTVKMELRSENPTESLGYDSTLRVVCVNPECKVQPKSQMVRKFDYRRDEGNVPREGAVEETISNWNTRSKKRQRRS